MKMFFKIPYTLILGLNLSLISCDKNQKASLDGKQIRQKSVSNKATEEEIKYFFPGGEYEINIEPLLDYGMEFEELDTGDYTVYINPRDIKDFNIVDLKWNPVDIKDIFETVYIENHPILKNKIDIEEYSIIEESYGPGRSSKRYCKSVDSDFISKAYIFDDKLLVRLYDKNNKIISENQMRRNVSFDGFDSNFAPKIKPYGRTDVWLMGMVRLPSKDQREGLKYRVVRVDENGNQKPFLWSLGKPYNYYHLEAPLEPYSEYSTWKYIEDLGCYHKAVYQRACNPPFLCSQ